MILTAFFVLVLNVLDTIPFKANEDFEIKLDLTFKPRDQTDATKTVVLDEARASREKRTDGSLLPYLKLHVKIIKVQPDEIKLKVFKDDGSAIQSKKVEEGLVFILDLGYTDDIKDRISGYKYVIQFYSAEKKQVSKILIEFDSEGNYFVNGERRGKI